jgi:hypothetical protein
MLFTHMYSLVLLPHRMVCRQMNEATEAKPIKMHLSRNSDYLKDSQFGSSFASARYVSIMTLLEALTATISFFLTLSLFTHSRNRMYSLVFLLPYAGRG